MIDASDILQIDGTIIAGILILLTVSSFTKIWRGEPLWWLRVTSRQAVGLVVVPFSISAIIILLHVNSGAFEETMLSASTFFTMAGFVYLILVVIFVKISEPKNNP